jgi:hypothetical protein
MDRSKAHMILKGVANLEDLFDLKERFEGPESAKTGSSCPLHETVNLGTPENPRNVNPETKDKKEAR